MSSFHKNFRLSGLFIVLTLFLASCGVVRKTSAPETITPSEELVIETGVASWYGSKFHGNLTANGEIYNMNHFTAAHKTLPFNTVVMVENERNGKMVVVRINDRGPYVGNRIIDLSRRAAREIDMENSGTAPVRLYFVEEGDRPLTTQNVSSRETFTVQLAAFDNRREAENYSNGISDTRVEEIRIAGRTVYRVYYGTFTNAEEAATAQRRLASRGYDGFVKQAEN